ncbi:hypothetical protein PEB0122_015360 [Bartonella apis]|nr:hypothetical protein PEB0122_015360 [Bartonella apis]
MSDKNRKIYSRELEAKAETRVPENSALTPTKMMVHQYDR